jgi:hypothetical protein
MNARRHHGLPAFCQDFDDQASIDEKLPRPRLRARIEPTLAPLAYTAMIRRWQGGNQRLGDLIVQRDVDINLDDIPRARTMHQPDVAAANTLKGFHIGAWIDDRECRPFAGQAP